MLDRVLKNMVYNQKHQKHPPPVCLNACCAKSSLSNTSLSNCTFISDTCTREQSNTLRKHPSGCTTTSCTSHNISRRPLRGHTIVKKLLLIAIFIAAGGMSALTAASTATVNNQKNTGFLNNQERTQAVSMPHSHQRLHAHKGCHHHHMHYKAHTYHTHAAGTRMDVYHFHRHIGMPVSHECIRHEKHHQSDNLHTHWGSCNAVEVVSAYEGEADPKRPETHDGSLHVCRHRHLLVRHPSHACPAITSKHEQPHSHYSSFWHIATLDGEHIGPQDDSDLENERARKLVQEEEDCMQGVHNHKSLLHGHKHSRAHGDCIEKHEHDFTHSHDFSHSHDVLEAAEHNHRDIYGNTIYFSNNFSNNNHDVLEQWYPIENYHKDLDIDDDFVHGDGVSNHYGGSNHFCFHRHWLELHPHGDCRQHKHLYQHWGPGDNVGHDIPAHDPDHDCEDIILRAQKQKPQEQKSPIKGSLHLT